MTINRRGYLGSIAAAAAMMALPFKPRLALAQTAQTITVTSYGGIWERAVRECFVADFVAKTGAKAEVVLGGPPQWLSQIEANPNNPPIHVLINTVDLALVAARKGLVEKISVDKVPNLRDIPRKFTDVVDGYGTTFDYGAAGLAYHKGRVKNPPKSFVEFINRTAKGEWTASLPGVGYAITPQILIWSLADVLGGSINNVDIFFETMKKIRKNVIFWNGINDFITHLETGEADIGVYFDGRAWAHYDTGATWIGYVNPKEGGAMSPVIVQKPKNAPEIAWKYMDSMLAPEPQTKFAKLLNYGVTNSKVVYPPGVLERITPWEATRWPPYEKIGDLRAKWIERWNKELGT